MIPAEGHSVVMERILIQEAGEYGPGMGTPPSLKRLNRLNQKSRVLEDG